MLRRSVVWTEGVGIIFGLGTRAWRSFLRRWRPWRLGQILLFGRRRDPDSVRNLGGFGRIFIGGFCCALLRRRLLRHRLLCCSLVRRSLCCSRLSCSCESSSSL